MTSTRELRSVDVAAGVVSGTLAAAFFTLAAVAAYPSAATAPVDLVDPAAVVPGAVPVAGSVASR